MLMKMEIWHGMKGLHALKEKGENNNKLKKRDIKVARQAIK